MIARVSDPISVAVGLIGVRRAGAVVAVVSPAVTVVVLLSEIPDIRAKVLVTRITVTIAVMVVDGTTVVCVS